MTLTTSSIKAVAQGNGATTSWPFTFIIPTLSDIVVTLVLISSGDETVLAPSVFTVTGLGVSAGGTVTYPLSGSPLSALYKIVVERFVPDLQQTDLVNQGGAYPADIEDALDYATMITQQLQDQLNRSIVFSVADTVPNGTLPLASARANKFLGFDSNGAPLVVDGLTAGTTVSAAMIPVVTAPTTADALVALGITGGSALLDLIIPSGTEWPYHAGGAAPAGFVYPIGQACTSVYPDYRAKLIAASSPYGTNGTDPLMPDLRSAVDAGKSNMGGVDNGLLNGGTVLGALLGTQGKALLPGNLPPYTPSGTVPSNVTDPSHTHTIGGVGAGSVSGGVQGGATFPAGTVAGGTNATGASNTGITVNSIFIGNAQGGTSSPFSIVQPTFICNKILKVH